jgi:hypothetical protein
VFTRLYAQFHFYPQYKNQVAKTQYQIDKHYPGTYIVVNNGNPGALPHAALSFGLAYSGNSKKEVYSRILAEAHPGFLWNQQTGFSHWGVKLFGTEIFSNSDSIYLYCRAATTHKALDEINNLFNQNNLQQFCTLKTVFQNTETGEAVVLSLNNTASIKEKLLPTETIRVTMEERTGGGEKFVSACGNYFLSGGSNQTNTQACEGTYSALMKGADAYALNLALPVKKGESIKLYAWQQSQNGNLAHWVASAPNSNHFYTSTAQTKAKAGQWHKTELMFQMPFSYTDTLINLYFWLPVNDMVWIDNMVIERFNP